MALGQVCVLSAATGRAASKRWRAEVGGGAVRAPIHQCPGASDQICWHDVLQQWPVGFADGAPYPDTIDEVMQGFAGRALGAQACEPIHMVGYSTRDIRWLHWDERTCTKLSGHMASRQGFGADDP